MLIPLFLVILCNFSAVYKYNFGGRVCKVNVLYLILSIENNLLLIMSYDSGTLQSSFVTSSIFSLN